MTEVSQEHDTAKDAASEKLVSLGFLAAGIIHEIASPITQIYSHILRIKKFSDTGPAELPSNVTKDIALSKAACERVIRIINSLKNIYQNSPGSMAWVPLADIFDDVLIATDDRLKSNKIKIEGEKIPSSVQIYCDRAGISQVLLNLLNNAIYAVEALKTKRWISFEWEETKQAVEFAIVDSGAGIPNEVKSRIFEPLFTTKPFELGAGLGLNTCRKIVEQHGGSIVLDETSQNTKFKVRLPKQAK